MPISSTICLLQNYLCEFSTRKQIQKVIFFFKKQMINKVFEQKIYLQLHFRLRSYRANSIDMQLRPKIYLTEHL